MCFHFFYTVQVDRHYLSESSLQLMLVSVFTSWDSEIKRTYSAQVGLYCVLLKKNNFCIMNKIKLVWFYSLHRNYFSEKNCNLFIYFKICFTMLHLKIFLEYWIILYIFRISLCVTSPFICKKLILNYKNIQVIFITPYFKL